MLLKYTKKNKIHNTCKHSLLVDKDNQFICSFTHTHVYIHANTTFFKIYLNSVRTNINFFYYKTCHYQAEQELSAEKGDTYNNGHP
jgi:hypothetical protein